jgi:hypothetical protein
LEGGLNIILKKELVGEGGTKMVFCGTNCKFLRPKEYEQTDEKEIHLCKKYNKRVLHLDFHPRLIRLPECDEPVVSGDKLTDP